MSFELTASMMCADYGSLEKEVKDLENGGIDSFTSTSWMGVMCRTSQCR